MKRAGLTLTIRLVLEIAAIGAAIEYDLKQSDAVPITTPVFATDGERLAWAWAGAKYWRAVVNPVSYADLRLREAIDPNQPPPTRQYADRLLAVTRAASAKLKTASEPADWEPVRAHLSLAQKALEACAFDVDKRAREDQPLYVPVVGLSGALDQTDCTANMMTVCNEIAAANDMAVRLIHVEVIGHSSPSVPNP